MLTKYLLYHLIPHKLNNSPPYHPNTDKEFFIDCKLWDTPNTVKTVVSKFIEMGATMTTVSTLNNPEVFNTLSEFNNDIELLGVTSLTSWTPYEEQEIHKQTSNDIWNDHIGKIIHNFAKNYYVFQLILVKFQVSPQSQHQY